MSPDSTVRCLTCSRILAILIVMAAAVRPSRSIPPSPAHFCFPRHPDDRTAYGAALAADPAAACLAQALREAGGARPGRPDAAHAGGRQRSLKPAGKPYVPLAR